ncbi:hypothetical protein ACHAW5_002184 [Stephanodiscus triporus]|uniref:Uncharacterized protein n=1 Tax=Stephanodiscus triporus TaxID=2934178 RepID=A0ABD3NFM9_9STRA
MAEFYIENGIDPGDPDSFDAWMAGCHAWGNESDYELEDDEDKDEDEETAHEQLRSAYLQRAQSVQRDRLAASSAARHWPLNESEVDYAAETRGWEKIDCERSEAPMASYKKDGVRLNFWISTGTVGSYLDHPSWPPFSTIHGTTRALGTIIRGSCRIPSDPLLLPKCPSPRSAARPCAAVAWMRPKLACTFAVASAVPGLVCGTSAEEITTTMNDNDTRQR